MFLVWRCVRFICCLCLLQWLITILQWLVFITNNLRKIYALEEYMKIFFFIVFTYVAHWMSWDQTKVHLKKTTMEIPFTFYRIFGFHWYLLFWLWFCVIYFIIICYIIFIFRIRNKLFHIFIVLSNIYYIFFLLNL